MYPEKTTDKIMIPQWEYRKLRDIATRVDVLLAEIDAEVIRHETEGYKYEAEFKASYIKRILAPHSEKQYTNDIRDVETLDTLADALGYTE
jgi:hypothetical protein